MNDFTKEELEKLLFSIKHGTPWGEEPIAIKIQSMIDSYCEHTPSDAHYEQFIWQVCSKCGVQYK